ncbi:LysM peptidoglycan-binding domain-containing protein [Glycomyces sp. MUSA5-2]|uniref:LysM peptidoglycan-binding domain-containing protein n=1 Tax=Glycomyces sp. MUSA5-2 TaxID=2053002 RepID=UPI00300A05A6
MTRIATSTTGPSFGARMAWGAVAGLGLGVLLAGVPVALASGFGWPPPVPDRDALAYPHLHESEFLAIALAWAGWLVWVWLACTVIAALVHYLRWGMRPETLRDSASPARWLAGALIGTVATALPATSALAAPAAPAQTSAGLETGADAETDAPTARPLVWTTTEAAPAEAETAAAATPVTGGSPDLDSGATVHTVRQGQDLWTIAGIHYHDPTLWPLIWEANKGTVFADGETFTDQDDIKPGWVLRIPAHTTAADMEPDDDGFITETVDPDETLSGYAEEYLGDASRYGEIFEANDDRVQADGRTLDDADVIVDGWQIRIPVEPDLQPAPAAEPEGEPPVPGDGDDGPVDTGPDEHADTEPPPPDPEPDPGADEDSTREAAEEERTGVLDAVPFGIWLTGGTCLAAATIAAIALRLKRRRAPADHGSDRIEPDAAWTGRLSDLEARIEAEHRKLIAAPAGPGPAMADPDEPESEAERGPVAVRQLAADGIGLLGPGQHGVARAAIIAAASAGAEVRLTQAANLRLDLDETHLPRCVTLTADIDGALAGHQAPGDVLLVCADTEVTPADPASLPQFLSTDGHGAIILGEWEPATVRVAGDGTIENAPASAADLGILHIADRDTTVSLLQSLKETDTTAAPPEDPAPAGAGTAAHGPTEPGHTVPGDVQATPGSRAPIPSDSAPTAAADPAGPIARLCLFGPPEVYIGDQTVAFKKGRRAKAFLAALALADGSVSRADLLHAVLPDHDDPTRARSNLNTIGSSLRGNLQQALGTESPIYHWDKHTDRYELDPAVFTTDRDAFDSAEQAAALATDPKHAAAQLEQVVRLYTDDLAPDLHTPQVDQLRAQYRAAAARAAQKLADHYAEHGDRARAEHHRARARILGANEPATP